MEYHYVYMTRIKGTDFKFYYIGKHSTENLNDRYLGSGEVMKPTTQSKNLKFLQKHDSNFVIDHKPIKFFESSQKAYDYENKLIFKAHLKYGINCVNLTTGDRIMRDIYIIQQRKLAKKPKIPKVLKKKPMSDATRRKISKAVQRQVKENRHPFQMLPWDNHHTKKSESQLRMWALMPEIYKMWVDTKVGSVKLSKLIESKYSLICCTKAMVKAFKNKNKIKRLLKAHKEWDKSC